MTKNLRWIAPALLLALIGMTVPSTASATCMGTAESYVCYPPGGGISRDLYASDLPTYKGWGEVRSVATKVPSCPTCNDMSSTAYYPTPAWRWTQAGWQKRERANKTSVYVWPWTTGWSWTWTSSTGWYAMRSERIYIRTDTGGPAAP